MERVKNVHIKVLGNIKSNTLIEELQIVNISGCPWTAEL